MRPDRMLAIEARLFAVGHSRWDLVLLPDGAAGVRISHEDTSPAILRVTRETKAAAAADVEFIARAPHDLRRLLQHVRGEKTCTRKELDAISDRVHKTSPAPWTAFLRTSGGLGGDSVIWVSDADDEPDLYLWFDADPAPDVYFEFVSSARQDVPDLLEEAGRM